MGKLLFLYMISFLFTLAFYGVGFLFFFGLSTLIINVFKLYVNVWILMGCIWLGYLMYRTTKSIVKDVIEQIDKDIHDHK